MAARRCLLTATVLLLAPALLPAQLSPPRRVLVIHSYDIGFRWTRMLEQSIRGVLQDDAGLFVTIDSEFLDARTNRSTEHLARTADYFRAKFAGTRFDALLVTDNAALAFAVRYRDEIFGPIPTVFAGINRFTPELLGGLSNVTGVSEEVEIRPTLAFIDRILAPGGELFVLHDQTETSQRNLDTAMRAIAELGFARNVTIVSEPTVGGLTELAQAVTSADAALLLGAIRDDEGRGVDPLLAARLVSAALPAPVFTAWDFLMGSGVTGGYLVTGTSQGRAAAELVARILDGTPATAIPIRLESPNEWQFDHGALRRHGVRRSALPDGATLINQRLSPWEEFTAEIAAIVAALVTLGVLSVALMLNIRTRGTIETQLRETLATNQTLMKEIHHRVKNNLQVVSSILNLQSGYVRDETDRGYFADCESRVRAIALVHEQLYQTASLNRIDVGDYIDTLAERLAETVASPGRRLEILTRAQHHTLSIDTIVPLGLLVTELVSNAAKHAYSDRDGTVRVTFSADRATARLEIEDHGTGSPDDLKPNGDSLGLKLVDALAQQLDGVVTYEAAAPGIRARVEFRTPPLAGTLIGVGSAQPTVSDTSLLARLS